MPAPKPCTRYTVEVFTRVEVDAASEDEACDEAVHRAMMQEATEWDTCIKESGPCEPKGKR